MLCNLTLRKETFTKRERLTPMPTPHQVMERKALMYDILDVSLLAACGSISSRADEKDESERSLPSSYKPFSLVGG